MDARKDELPLTERKVMRRGLIGGLAGLGAAVLIKLSGTEKAEAVHQAEDVGLNINNAGTATTQITASVSAAPGFTVTNGGSAPTGKSGIVGVTDVAGGGGVRGHNDNNAGFGVFGLGSTNGIGIKGLSNASNFTADGDGSGIGVLGKSTNGFAVQALDAGNGYGLYATSGAGGVGVSAISAGGPHGVRGINNVAADFGTTGSGSGIGVQGKSTSGPGVQGLSSSSYGVEGQASAVAGFGVRGVNAANGTGIKGVSNTGGNLAGDGTGSGTGVLGKSTSGIGVEGASSTGIGVFGHSATAVAGGVGVQAISGSHDGYGLKAANYYSDGTGILGTSDFGVLTFVGDGTGIGVQGRSRLGSGVQGDVAGASGIGVRGVNTADGTAVKGVSNTGGNLAGDGTGGGIGVHGKSSSGAGVKGESTSGPGVDGISTSSLGVRGTSTNFVGVVGISTNNHGLYGYSTGLNGVALVGDNQGGGLAGLFQGSVVITGGLQVGGAKNAVVKMPDGSNALVYCQEAPEPYFEDFGRARLVGGVANVTLEPQFASLVAGGEYHVFTEAEGETKGLFVSRRNGAGFEVREIGGGTGSVPFSYRIVTRRKDIEGRRFARVNDDATRSIAAARAALGITSSLPPNTPAPTPFVPPSGPSAQPPISPPSNGSSSGGGPTR